MTRASAVHSLRSALAAALLLAAGATSPAAAQTWTTKRVLRIGAADGPAAYTFGTIPALAVDEVGRVYVIDGQAKEVRLFDARGRYVRTFGRKGGGPGEFTLPMAVAAAHGAFTVFDPQLRRVSTFDADTGFVTSARFDYGTLSPYGGWQALPDGRLAVGMQEMGMMGGTPSTQVMALSPSAQDALFSLPGPQTIRFGAGGPQITLLAPEPVWAVLPDGRFVTAMSDEPRLTVRDRSGAPVGVIALDRTEHRFSSSERDRIRQSAIDQLGAQRAPSAQTEQAKQQLMDRLRVAPAAPVVPSLLAGPDGTVLVLVTPEVDALLAEVKGGQAASESPRRWDVYRVDGKPAGSVTFPARFTPKVVRGGLVYGVSLDRDDVPYVDVLRMSVGGRGQ